MEAQRLSFRKDSKHRRQDHRCGRKDSKHRRQDHRNTETQKDTGIWATETRNKATQRPVKMSPACTIPHSLAELPATKTIP